MPPNCTQYENLVILKTHSQKLNASCKQISPRTMCHFLEEISSIYYSKDQMKVCPAVIHYKGVNGVQYLKHKSLAVLSDEMTKYCIIKVIVGWIKHVSIGTSQSWIWCQLYKVMFDLSASWQYFETVQGNVVKDRMMGDVGLRNEQLIKCLQYLGCYSRTTSWWFMGTIWRVDTWCLDTISMYELFYHVNVPLMRGHLVDTDSRQDILVFIPCYGGHQALI